MQRTMFILFQITLLKIPCIELLPLHWIISIKYGITGCRLYSGTYNGPCGHPLYHGQPLWNRFEFAIVLVHYELPRSRQRMICSDPIEHFSNFLKCLLFRQPDNLFQCYSFGSPILYKYSPNPLRCILGWRLGSGLGSGFITASRVSLHDQG
jgi:hypothetical protein